jgi:hypothetical protein
MAGYRSPRREELVKQAKDEAAFSASWFETPRKSAAPRHSGLTSSWTTVSCSAKSGAASRRYLLFRLRIDAPIHMSAAVSLLLSEQRTGSPWLPQSIADESHGSMSFALEKSWSNLDGKRAAVFCPTKEKRRNLVRLRRFERMGLGPTT